MRGKRTRACRVNILLIFYSGENLVIIGGCKPRFLKQLNKPLLCKIRILLDFTVRAVAYARISHKLKKLAALYMLRRNDPDKHSCVNFARRVFRIFFFFILYRLALLLNGVGELFGLFFGQLFGWIFLYSFFGRFGFFGCFFFRFSLSGRIKGDRARFFGRIEILGSFRAFYDVGGCFFCTACRGESVFRVKYFTHSRRFGKTCYNRNLTAVITENNIQRGSQAVKSG